MSGSSLVPFHRVLITAAILFCAGFGAWSVWFDQPRRPVLGVVFLALAVGLAVYLWNLRRVLGMRDEDAG